MTPTIKLLTEAAAAELRVQGVQGQPADGSSPRQNAIHLDGWFDLENVVAAVLKAVREPPSEVVDSAAFHTYESANVCAIVWTAMIDATLAQYATQRSPHDG